MRVSALAERADVYCLAVPFTHAFAVEDGYVVANSQRALNYGVIAFEPAQPTQQTLAKLERREFIRSQRDHDPADLPRRRRVGGYGGGY